LKIVSEPYSRKTPTERIFIRPLTLTVKTKLQTLGFCVLLTITPLGLAQETPVPDPAKEPVFAVEGGLGIGLWPLRGPKGLIRIYAPLLGVEPPAMVNFIAVEPIVNWQKGFSELEKLDFKVTQAKRTGQGLEYRISTGLFQNGANLDVIVRLDRDKPEEVYFQVFSNDQAAYPFAVILTATMGNYAGLREVWLANGPVHTSDMWVAPIPRKPWGEGFSPHREFYPLTLRQADGWVMAAASPDASGAPAHNTEASSHWHYKGRVATQYWKARPADKLRLRVNARATYWGGTADISGGPAIENFEFAAPFKQGQEFIFGVSEKTPSELGFSKPARPALKQESNQ
jgi:hypothetical protein